jgi:hypothetical protein
VIVTMLAGGALFFVPQWMDVDIDGGVLSAALLPAATCRGAYRAAAAQASAHLQRPGGLEVHSCWPRRF